MKVLNFPSQYPAGQSPYEVFQNQMAAIQSIAEGIKNIRTKKYWEGFMDKYATMVDQEMSEADINEIYGILTSDEVPDDVVNPEELNEFATAVVDKAMRIQQKNMMMDNLVQRQSTATANTGQTMIPKNAMMQIYNWVSQQGMGKMNYAPLLEHMKGRPGFMGNLLPLEQQILSDAMGRTNPTDKAVADLQKAQNIYDMIFPEQEKEQEQLKYVSTQFGILNKATGEVQPMEIVESDANYQIVSVTDKDGNVNAFFVNKNDPNQEAIPIKGLPTGKKGSGGTDELHSPTHYEDKDIRKIFSEKVENMNDFVSEINRLKSLNIDTTPYETTEYFAEIMKEKFDKQMEFIKYSFDKISNWKNLTEEQIGDEEYTLAEYHEWHQKYWELAKKYDQEYFNVTGQHLLTQ